MGRIGIYGGAFNPPSLGHKQVAEMASDLFDEIWLVCTYNHALGKQTVSYDHRINMCNIMTKDMEKVETTILKDNGTYEFSKKLKEEFPEHQFTFIIGQDCADNFNFWRNWYELQEENPFLIFTRKGYPINTNQSKWYMKGHHTYIKDVESLEISSTQIRELLSKNEDIDHLVSREIIDYIKENNLYV